jgi:hypothetical protein
MENICENAVFGTGHIWEMTGFDTAAGGVRIK